MANTKNDFTENTIDALLAYEEAETIEARNDALDIVLSNIKSLEDDSQTELAFNLRNMAICTVMDMKEQQKEKPLAATLHMHA